MCPSDGGTETVSVPAGHGRVTGPPPDTRRLVFWTGEKKKVQGFWQRVGRKLFRHVSDCLTGFFFLGR